MGRTLSALFLMLLLCACQVPAQWLEPGTKRISADEQYDETTRFRRQYLAAETLQPHTRLAYDPESGKIPARTVLTAQGLEIQNDRGCIACHPEKMLHAREKLGEEGVQ